MMGDTKYYHKLSFYKEMSIIAVTILIFFLLSVFAKGEPTQQYNKIYLQPFYRASMTQNTNYLYTLAINPPDKISSVLSAIISFDVYITPSVSFNLTVNGVSCNNPLYTISTTYASAGQSRITFDCSNIITKSGTYNIVLRPSQANTGSITGWIDITYMNNPSGNIDISGTEYSPNDNGTVFLQMLDNQQKPINNSLCYLDMFSPDKTKILDSAMMTYLLDSRGLYYYDFIVSNITGVYMLSANCYYYYNLTYISASKDTNIRSSANTTNYGNETYFPVGQASFLTKIIGLVEFNLTNISSPSEIEEVWLYLYGVSSLSNPTINLYRITSIWNEANVTWNTIPTINTTIYATKTTVLGWNLWNITLLAKSWLNGTFTNYGLMLNSTPSVASFNFTTFSSRENSVELSPRLLVKYKTLQEIDTIRGSGEVHVSASICPSQIDMTNYSLINYGVWNFSVRNLTYYPQQQDMTNYSYITESVWSSVGRYIHGTII